MFYYRNSMLEIQCFFNLSKGAGWTGIFVQAAPAAPIWFTLQVVYKAMPNIDTLLARLYASNRRISGLNRDDLPSRHRIGALFLVPRC